MYKKKSLLITFEGIEGSGKSYQSKKLFKKLKKIGLPVIHTREPGGTGTAEKIRKVLLDDYFHPDKKHEFNKYTDTLLYLASRSEHIEKKIKPAISKKNIILCDRFIDSTIAYQVYGKRVNINLVNFVHKYILENIRPNLTFILKADVAKALKRLNKRKKKNRYDKFTKSFYNKVQKAFIKIAKSNKKRFKVIDNSDDDKNAEKIILKNTLKYLT